MRVHIDMLHFKRPFFILLLRVIFGTPNVELNATHVPSHVPAPDAHTTRRPQHAGTRHAAPGTGHGARRTHRAALAQGGYRMGAAQKPSPRSGLLAFCLVLLAFLHPCPRLFQMLQSLFTSCFAKPCDVAAVCWQAHRCRQPAVHIAAVHGSAPEFIQSCMRLVPQLRRLRITRDTQRLPSLVRPVALKAAIKLVRAMRQLAFQAVPIRTSSAIAMYHPLTANAHHYPCLLGRVVER